jgi:hypothetical protein
VSSNNEGRLCEIYRCSKKEGMYIYVDKKDGLEKLPDSLNKRTGKMVFAMGLMLTPDKKLARANAKDVLEAIEAQGFYLQMPPSLYGEAKESSQAITEANNFLESQK